MTLLYVIERRIFPVAVDKTHTMMAAVFETNNGFVQVKVLRWHNKQGPNWRWEARIYKNGKTVTEGVFHSDSRRQLFQHIRLKLVEIQNPAVRKVRERLEGK